MAIESTMETITPAKAEEYLTKNTTNRKMSTNLVASYVNDIKAGMWKTTHQGIAFNDRGELMDGQHRLAAIVQADQSVEMMVFRGVSHENMSVLDIGKKRNVADMLRIEGHDNFTVVAAVARLALAYEMQTYTTRQVRAISNALVYEYAERYIEEIARASEQAVFFHGKIPATHSVLGTAWLIFSRIDPEACAEFFNALAFMRTDGENDPRLALFRRLTNIRGDRIKANQFQLLDMFVRTWNLWRAGKQADKLALATTPQWRRAV